MGNHYGLVRRSVLRAACALPVVGSVSTSSASEPTAYVESDGDRIRLGNRHLEFVFRRDNGGLEQFYDNDAAIAFLGTEFDASSWLLRFYSRDYEYLEADSKTRTPEITTATNADGAGLTLEWSNPPLEAPSGDVDAVFDATATLEVSLGDGERLSRWRLAVDNRSERAVRQVVCPFVTGVTPLESDGSDALYVPSRLGRKFENPTESELGVHRYPSGFGTMQFVAYLADGVGLYASAEDPNGYAKRLEFVEHEGRAAMDYQAAHLVPYRPGGDVSLPYAMTLGTLAGDWRAACDRYREWAETDGWLRDADPLVPDRLRDRGVTFHERSYTRSRSENQLEPISFDEMARMVPQLQERLDAPIGFRWWGWSTHGFPALGDWWPPYEGVDAFADVVDTLTATDVGVIGFVNPTGLAPFTDFWQSRDEPEALPMRARSGELRTADVFLEDTEKYRMATTQSGWQRHYQSVLDNLVSNGVTELDIDGFPWQWIPDCWADEHDHPPGKGGNWYPTRMRQHLASLHRRYDVDGGLILGGEGIADFYLPSMNAVVLRDGAAEFDDPLVADGVSEVVPLFPYTFGEYAATRIEKGHIGTHVPQRNVQRLFAGRAVAWGATPTFMGHYEPVAETEQYDSALVEYYARIAEARTGYANRFLARGRMLARPTLDRRTVTITQRGRSIRTDELRGRGWRAPNGDLGVVLTNVSNRDEGRQITLDFADQPYDLPETPTAYRVRNGDYASVDGLRVDVELAPSDIALIGVLPADADVGPALSAIETAQASSGVDSERLTEAKRAFDGHDFQTARTKAKRAVAATDEPTGAATERSVTAPTRATSGDENATSDDGSGLRVVSALIGVAGALAGLRWFADEER